MTYTKNSETSYNSKMPNPFNFGISTAAKISLIWLAFSSIIFFLDAGQELLKPIYLAVVVGLMTLPIANRFEKLGIPPGLSALIIVVLLISLVSFALTVLAIPLSTWTDRLPFIIWKINNLFSSWREALLSTASVREIFDGLITTDESIKLEIKDTKTVTDAALTAPALLAQKFIFLASLYFFVATRHSIRNSAISLFSTFGWRLRIARVFRDIENKVASYLAQITIINIAFGAVVSIAMWLLDVPSPILWGALAMVFNYIVYIGPAIMVGVLLLVGLSVGGSIGVILAPAAVFLMINLVEANFITPHFIGRSLTLNPFLVFLALAFWIWIWGPAGGFIAVPMLLVLQTIFINLYGFQKIDA